MLNKLSCVKLAVRITYKTQQIKPIIKLLLKFVYFVVSQMYIANVALPNQYAETFRNPPSQMEMETPHKVEVLSNKLYISIK